MTDQDLSPEKKKWCCHGKSDGTASAVYGLGLIGTAVYYLGQADTFGLGALGILKAIVWPAILVYELLKFFQL